MRFAALLCLTACSPRPDYALLCTQDDPSVTTAECWEAGHDAGYDAGYDVHYQEGYDLGFSYCEAQHATP